MPMTLVTLQEETGIDASALANMRCMYAIIKDSEGIDASRRTEIQKMLAGMIGDMSLNRQLDTLAPMSGVDTGIGVMVVGNMKDISYRTRHLIKIEPDLDRIWENFEARKDSGKVLAEDEKISLEQYGILNDLATLNNTLEEYSRKGLIAGNEKLERLYTQTKRAAVIISHLDKTFNESFTMPTGAVVFDETTRKSEVYGKLLGFFDEVVDFFVTKFSHASKGYALRNAAGDTENKISHINPSYKQERFNLRNYLYSDVYQIKIENLIDDDTKQLLKENFGEEWLAYVKQKFGDIERQIHDMNRSGHMHIIANGRIDRSLRIASAVLLGGHENMFTNDHSNADIRDDIFGRGKWASEGDRGESRLLCSEFVGKTIIASVQELNDVLKAELLVKGVTSIPDPIVDNPISEAENLCLLTPERLLSAMEERGAVEKVGVSAALTGFVTIEKTDKMRRQIQELKELSGANEEDILTYMERRGIQ